MDRLKRWVGLAGSRPPWIIALLVAAVAALRASDQYVLAMLCLAAATILLSAKIVHAAVSHEPHSTTTRGVLASIGALVVIVIAVAVGIGLRPRAELPQEGSSASQISDAPPQGSTLPSTPLEPAHKMEEQSARTANEPVAEPTQEPADRKPPGRADRQTEMPRAPAGEPPASAATENRTLFIDCRIGTMPRPRWTPKTGH
jgi:hypothetical protein